LNGPIDNLSAGPILGIDESGKGDFFGPLIIAGVLADAAGAERLRGMGVRDSKKISDRKIIELSDWIAGNFVHTVVIVGPEKYNQLYSKIRNLNRLLAWGHSRVIENIAAEHDIELAISDKFGKSESIEKALMAKGRQIRLEQMVRGEAIVQVAAASILARAGFVRSMERLSGEYVMRLPKGAGAPVDEAARQLVARHGPAVLEKSAKIHFKNYRKVLG